MASSVATDRLACRRKMLMYYHKPADAATEQSVKAGTTTTLGRLSTSSHGSSVVPTSWTTWRLPTAAAIGPKASPPSSEIGQGRHEIGVPLVSKSSSIGLPLLRACLVIPNRHPRKCTPSTSAVANGAAQMAP